MSLLQRLLKRPTKQFPERLVQRPLRESSVLAGLAGQFGQGFDNGIHLDFANDFHYIKSAGNDPTIAPFTSLFTFTGDNKSMYRGKNGLLISSATNTPRIEYDVNGKCLGLLIEGARTNLSLRSQEFNNAAWSTVRASVSANAIDAPDGTTTADKLVDDSTAGATHFILPAATMTITADATFTVSIFAKAGERTQLRLTGSDATETNFFGAFFNLSTGATGSTTTGGTGALTTKTITAYANGWYRLTVTGSVGSGVTACRLIVKMAVPTETLPYNGDGASGLYLWGAQFENAVSFPSSYIPTTTGSVTRASEEALRSFGAEYSATLGTAFVEADTNAVNTSGSKVFFCNDGNGHWIQNPSASSSITVFDGTNTATSGNTITNSTMFKAASALNANGMAISLNGGTVATASFDGTFGAAATVNVGTLSTGNHIFGHIRRLDYWPERKPNSELQRLTS